MKERPILFSSPMVHALLNGTKTKTRRIVKDQDRIRKNGDIVEYLNHFGNWQPWEDRAKTMRCPYGQPGDRLWVRETWMPDAPRDGTWDDFAFFGSKGSPLSMIPRRFQTPKHCLFRASWDSEKAPLVGWKPSIHMPRWASRINLEITSVRVERLQDISEADAIAEGIEKVGEFFGVPSFRDYGGGKTGCEAILSYETLWESINGPGSWDANPWVWRIEFERAEGCAA